MYNKGVYVSRPTFHFSLITRIVANKRHHIVTADIWLTILDSLSGPLMNHLEISLLGPFKVTLDGKPVTRFEADTARALLAYLALCASTQAPCRRETLAGLLWPEQPEAEARHNLRQALSRLRRAIGDRDADPPFLLITRQTIQLNPEADAWLDVAAFDDRIAACQGHPHRRLEACHSCMQRMGEAADLYQGDLLGSFSVNSAPFEDWLVAERERRHRQALDALEPDWERGIPGVHIEEEDDPHVDAVVAQGQAHQALQGRRHEPVVQNREVAMRVLRGRLTEIEEEKRQEELAELKGDHVDAGWGNQIRSYVLHPYHMVKDHRTDYEVGNAQAVLDGQLDGFMEEYLRFAVNAG